MVCDGGRLLHLMYVRVIVNGSIHDSDVCRGSHRRVREVQGDTLGIVKDLISEVRCRLENMDILICWDSV